MDSRNADALLRHEAARLGGDKGRSLVNHGRAVQKMVVFHGGDMVSQSIGLLHDVVEDCLPGNMDPEEYANSLTMTDEVRSVVLELTRREGEDYFEYIGRVANGSFRAGFVKRCDLRVNLLRCEENGRLSLKDRYTRALRRLGDTGA